MTISIWPDPPPMTNRFDRRAEPGNTKGNLKSEDQINLGNSPCRNRLQKVKQRRTNPSRIILSSISKKKRLSLCQKINERNLRPGCAIACCGPAPAKVRSGDGWYDIKSGGLGTLLGRPHFATSPLDSDYYCILSSGLGIQGGLVCWTLAI